MIEGESEGMATWLTPEEASQHLKIGKSTLCQLSHDAKVSAQKLGTAWRFDVEEFDEWLKSGGQLVEPQHPKKKA